MSGDEQQIGDSDLTGLTGGDEARARALRKSLQRLAGGEHVSAPLREMANEVLAGRIGLRQAMHIDSYSEALGEQVARGSREYQELPPEEVARQKEAAEEYLAEQRAEIEAERGDGDEGPGGPDGPGGGSGSSGGGSGGFGGLAGGPGGRGQWPGSHDWRRR
ncbi:hypothetical protein MTQ01_00415 [Streptomyces sp. XM4193]|uniref:hypothetical protein n=1 Tax=Streptomyces sp. XM4193 TaxID=2929782 RepID=UPI001FF9E44F|nr:hypothetical protein [Streptomyces sp. XM4193]MCK1794515.1 hypothetical protein [Streptomyces sp. XM4193]